MDRLELIWSGHGELVRGGDPSAPLQRLLPATRLLCAGLLLVTVLATRHPGALAAVCVACGAAAWLGRLSLRAYTLSILLLAGVFVAPVALLGAHSFFNPGPVALKVGPLVFSRPGLDAALLLILRAMAALSVTTLLIRSAGIRGVIDGLRVLRVPESLLALLQMTFAHIHLLGRSAHGMVQGMRARTLREPGLGVAYRSVATQGGILLEKSLAASRDVHGAMLARGFTGTFPLASEPLRKWKAADVAVVGVCLGGAVLATVCGR